MNFTIEQFETAILKCGYTLVQIKRENKEDRHQITTVIGCVPNPVNRNQTKLVRWDSLGQCFCYRSAKRLPAFDLSLTII